MLTRTQCTPTVSFTAISNLYVELVACWGGNNPPQTNILIDHTGTAILSDFGLSVVRGNENEVVHGTPRYMAPESRDNVSLYSFAADIWGFGCVFGEVCSYFYAREILNTMAGGIRPAAV